MARADSESISRIVTGSDTVTANRRLIWDLPVVPDTAIAFVTDSATCLAAARAHAVAGQADTVALARVHVLRVGSDRFVVFNYSMAGEYVVFNVFDAAFNLIKTLFS